MPNASPPFTPRSEFWGGLRATIPLLIGSAPFGLIFGAIAVNSGLSLPAAAGFSAIVFAGSAQFIGAGLVASGVSVGFIILTTLIVNLRHTLYGATLAPHTKNLPQRWLLPLAFCLTDETFVVVISRYTTDDGSPHKHWYFLGSALPMYINWQICTWIGILVGQSIPNPGAWGLDGAAVAAFLGLLWPRLKGGDPVATAVVAALATIIAMPFVPPGIPVVIAAVVTAGWWALRRRKVAA